jgi:hypothetical protein
VQAIRGACDARGRKLRWTTTVRHIATGLTIVGLKVE